MKRSVLTIEEMPKSLKLTLACGHIVYRRKDWKHVPQMARCGYCLDEVKKRKV